jgi:glc operon protein GlcG
VPMVRMLGHEEAAAAVEAIRAELTRRSDAAVVAVGDAHGELVALLRMDGAPVSAVPVAVNKAYTAARMRRPSRAIGDALRDPARGVSASFYGDRRYVGWAGGLPVVIGGAVVGAVGVSGMSQDLDEEMARIGVAAMLGRDGTGTG